MTLKTIEGTFIAPKGRYALVVGRFNSFVVESLVSGAVDALVRHGVSESDITIIRAPGAFEIPLVAQKVAQQGAYDAIIALGAVIRGGTPHFEYVAGECTKGLAQVSMEFGVPVAFGVLTVDSIEQASSVPAPRPATKVLKLPCPHWKWSACWRSWRPSD